MPTIIALDISLSMQRPIPGRSEENAMTFHQLALKGISHFLEHLTNSSKLEYIALVTYSSGCELKVDFTREYDTIRSALKKIDAGDKTCIISMLKCVAVTLSSNWGIQNKCQVIAFTDCGIGFGNTSLISYVKNFTEQYRIMDQTWIEPLKAVKLNFLCMGVHMDNYFIQSLDMYQKLLNTIGLNGELYMTKNVTDALEEIKNTNTDDSDNLHIDNDSSNDNNSNNASNGNNINNNLSISNSNSTGHSSHKSELGRTVMFELVDRIIEGNFKPYEATLKCGGYFRLESNIILWPSPVEFQIERSGVMLSYNITPKLEICGYLPLADIGSPASLSRHLILPKVEREKSSSRRPDKGNSLNKNSNVKTNQTQQNQQNQEFEKLEQDIKDFYTKDAKDGDDSSDDVIEVKVGSSNNSNNELQKENVCVLLHGALKLENLAGVVVLGENWYGYIYAYADSKKKSNLMLNILQPGNDTIPWLGDFQMFGMAEDQMPGENNTFPVKAEKRSYSQSCVVWIRHVSLQSDIQKILRHAKKMPEKTQHFYKELNRIRRSALSIGFVELLEAMATIFEKESVNLSLTANPECSLQLQHAAIELRKPSGRDFKVTIGPVQYVAEQQQQQQQSPAQPQSPVTGPNASTAPGGYIY